MVSTTMSLIQQLAEQVQTYVLLGPPGTGKTTDLTRQVNDAVARGWEPLIASLTKAAARELGGRDLELDPRRVGTLHAHAWRALDGPTIAEGELKAWNAWIIQRGLGSNWNIPESYGKKAKLDDPHDRQSSDENGERSDATDWLESAGVLRARMVPPAHWADTRVRRWYEVWCEWKREQGLLDFTDLIEVCYRDGVMPALDFDALYIDESQDCSALEMALVLRWGAHARAVVVTGDPYQNLYQWRGSDPNVLLELHASAKQTRTLGQSFRVSRAVHSAAMTMLNDPMESYVYLPRPVDGLVSRRLDVTLNDPEHVALLLRDDLERQGTVMLLAACAYQLNGVVAVLRELGVPFWNPYRVQNGRWNPLSSARKLTSSAGRVVAFSRVDESIWNGSSRFWTGDEIAAWADLVEAKVFTRKADLTDLKGDETEIAPDWLADRVREPADLEAIFSGDLLWLREHALPSRSKTLDFPLRVAQKTGVKALEEVPRLVIGTVHSVKGGECDRVWVFPDLSPAGYDDYLSNDEATRRLFYVAMTRARDELVLCGPSSGRSIEW